MFFKRKEPKSKEKLVEKWCELNSILDKNKEIEREKIIEIRKRIRDKFSPPVPEKTDPHFSFVYKIFIIDKKLIYLTNKGFIIKPVSVLRRSEKITFSDELDEKTVEDFRKIIKTNNFVEPFRDSYVEKQVDKLEEEILGLCQDGETFLCGDKLIKVEKERAWGVLRVDRVDRQYLRDSEDY